LYYFYRLSNQKNNVCKKFLQIFHPEQGAGLASGEKKGRRGQEMKK